MGNGKGRSGSSPLARGLRMVCVRVLCTCGIIPARAGFTRRPWATARASRDHPRSRGVYRLVTWPRVPDVGSSPLARGLRGSGNPGRARGRIIPARAGFTPPLWPQISNPWDHPRSRGVYQGMTHAEIAKEGSSPLARGLRWRPRMRSEVRRIIPARAGFTLGGHLPRLEGLDHPRSRGVYLDVSGIEGSDVGSSPLARGLLGRDRPRRRGVRIIPARAGFTPDRRVF